MDSISPGATRIAGNHSDLSGVRTFTGKLVDSFRPGRSALTAAHRRSGRTPLRAELAS